MTALDTNVLIALWNIDPHVNTTARDGLEAARKLGALVVCAPVFAELRAGQGRTDASLDQFFSATGISLDWSYPESLWRAAGANFQRCDSEYRSLPRRILADFLIATHAAWRCGRLLTLDAGLRGLGVTGLEIVVL